MTNLLLLFNLYISSYFYCATHLSKRVFEALVFELITDIADFTFSVCNKPLMTFRIENI